MALPRTSVPLPTIFNTDPIEQVYAKQLFDPQQSGIAFGMLNAAKMDREGMQDQYRTDLANANALNAALQRQSMQSEQLQTAMKEGWHYTDQGFKVPDMPALAANFRDPNSPSVDAPSSASLAKKLAEINKLNAEAAAKFGEAGPKLEAHLASDAYGPGQIDVKVKGGSAAQQQALLNEAARRQAVARGQPDPGPTAPLKRPGSVVVANPTSQARIAYPGVGQ